MNCIRQTRIFLPRVAPFEDQDWAWTAIGKTIAPLVASYEHAMTWFWFSRYKCPKEIDGGDCDISKVPEAFMHPETKHYTSIRFRYRVESDTRGVLEAFLEECIRNSGCMITDFRDYDFISDLGGDRFLEEPRTPKRRQERAELVAANFHSIARLVLHALDGPDAAGHFHLPHSFAKATPFQDLHHIFCNMSDVPLYVTAREKPRWPWQTAQNVRRRVYF